MDLSILVIDANPDRARIVETGLVEAGYAKVMTIQATANLTARIQAVAPDVVIIDLENPDRDTLEAMFQVSRAVQKPIAMFVDRSDQAAMAAAVSAGVSAYVVDGLKKERIQPIVEMAVMRFHAFDKLRRERDEALTALADRKVIDKAKGILMRQKALDEEQAYALMRKTAMKHGRKIADIAQSVVTAAEMDI
ncbi:MAG TPA: ANTAR domain-containing protein [Azospirillaceae bacterium]|nr:ANTAR domain-containing protein [Terricaulis sp.]HRQ79556.1 ANTAR domain-containing protein [Azospirillaceae bacterium]